MNLTEILLLYLSILFTLNFVSKILKKLFFKEKKKYEHAISQPAGFETDILFLNNLIAVSLKNYEKYIIAPAKAGKRIINDDEEE